MVLVDTSVWIEHPRHGHPALDRALAAGEVVTHPFVLGELACGGLGKAREIRTLLGALPRVDEATHDEVVAMVDARRLAGSGIGWIDAHLLAAALIARIDLMTLDRALAAAWERLARSR